MSATHSQLRPLAALLIAMLFACDSGSGDAAAGTGDAGSTPTTSAFVGAVDGTTAMVGLVHDGDNVAAYVCGHADTLSTHTRWFDGTFEEDGVTFTLNSEEWHLTGALTDGVVHGDLVGPDGEVALLTLDAAASGNMTGLYSVLDGGCRAGLIVIDTGTLVTQGAWCDGSGLIMQVTPMMPVALVDGGIQVSVDEAEPEHVLTMSPHTP